MPPLRDRQAVPRPRDAEGRRSENKEEHLRTQEHQLLLDRTQGCGLHFRSEEFHVHLEEVDRHQVLHQSRRSFHSVQGHPEVSHLS